MNVMRQIPLKLYIVISNMLLHKKFFIKLNLTKWTKTSSKMFKKQKPVERFIKN